MTFDTYIFVECLDYLLSLLAKASHDPEVKLRVRVGIHYT